jgi:DNA-nicking Smr family endonuclease
MSKRARYIRSVAKKPFNDAFSRLRALQKAQARPARPATAPPPPPPPAPAARSEQDLWADAISGVKPLANGTPTAPPPPPPRASGPVWHPDLDAIDELRALVSGDAPFDIADTDEYVEGRGPGVDQSLVRKLRRGEFAVQGHLDLHGLTREEAKGAVDDFLRRARQGGKRCVLLVHGRGIHSKDQVPVLKDALRTWLSTARFGRHVLAFATALPVDGGGGAVYVLLRRAGR